jgi:hypothetical protein
VLARIVMLRCGMAIAAKKASKFLLCAYQQLLHNPKRVL